MLESALDRTIPLGDEIATTALAARLAPLLRAGDTLLLSGPVGAGKSHFARSLIRAAAGAQIDVPSPTFTLVQTYGTPQAEIWHADLYRLGHVDEIIELGLEEAFDTAICLIEWPDRLAGHHPANALHLALAPGPTQHHLTITDPSGTWASRLAQWP